MKTRTRCAKTKGLGTHTHPVTQKHTGNLDVHRQEAVCVMPVFFRPGCRARGARRRRKDGDGGR